MKNDPLTISPVEITPAIARRWLAKNTRNRPVRTKHVQFLMSQMATCWRVNGETIKIAANGTVLDGQHRLLACVESGLPFKSIVVSGIEDDCFSTIDIGQKRTAADALHVAGFANSVSLAAGLTLIDRYETERMTTRAILYTPEQVIELTLMHPDAVASAHYAASNKNRLLAPSIQVAAHYLFSKAWNRDAAERFLERLRDGDQLSRGDAILTLRARLIDNAASKAKLSQEYLFALVIKAWNSFVSGRQLKALRWGENELFPEIWSIEDDDMDPATAGATPKSQKGTDHDG